MELKPRSLEVALEKFQNNEATASKAAEIAEMPLTSFLDVLQNRGINFHYGVKELRKDFERI